MNLIEELQSLDVNEPGRWPLPFRVAAAVLLFAGVTVFGSYLFVIKTEIPVLEEAELEEQNLRSTFEQKQRKAANFDAYRMQLAEIQENFGTMLRQLPGSTEVPSLLEDISQTALAAGLQEELFEPGGEVKREFYAELPIRTRYTGSYHDIGNFVSGIAALPRIVTLHDIAISPVSEGSWDELTLDVTAKTYRYLEQTTEETTGG